MHACKWAAHKQKWEHPTKSVLTALEEKTKDRIIHTYDIPWADGSPNKADEATESEWQILIKQLGWDSSSDKLWVQCAVPE